MRFWADGRLLGLQRQLDVDRDPLADMDDYILSDDSLEAALAGGDLVVAGLQIGGNINTRRIGGESGFGFGVLVTDDNIYIRRREPLRIGNSSDDRAGGGLRLRRLRAKENCQGQQ